MTKQVWLPDKIVEKLRVISKAKKKDMSDVLENIIKEKYSKLKWKNYE